MTEERFCEIHIIKNSHDELGRRDMIDFDIEISPEEENEYWKIWNNKQKEFEMLMS